MTVAVLVAIFATIILSLSLFGVMSPEKLTSIVSKFMHGRSGLPVAIAVRLLLAALLWLAAPASRTPFAFQVLALLALIAALALPLLGKPRLLRMVDKFRSWPALLVRAWCLVGVAFGAFLLWSLAPVLGLS